MCLHWLERHGEHVCDGDEGTEDGLCLSNCASIHIHGGRSPGFDRSGEALRVSASPPA